MLLDYQSLLRYFDMWYSYCTYQLLKLTMIEVYCKSLLTYEQLVEAVVLLHLPLAEDDDRERVADEAHQAQAADQIAAHNLVKPEKHTIQFRP